MGECRLGFSILFALLIAARTYAGGPVVYAVTSVNWEPYWLISEQKIGGILNDVMTELDRRIPHFLFASPDFPVKRSRLTFHNGGTIIECCINQDWREPYDSGGKTLWSDTVLMTEELLVFPKGGSFPVTRLEDLKGKSIATILGYGYLGNDHFIRHDAMDNIAQLSMVAKKRTDAAIMDNYEYQYMLRNSSEVQNIADKIETGPVINRTELKMRIHSSRPDLVAPINSAISKMKTDGTIKKIIFSYTYTNN